MPRKMVFISGIPEPGMGIQHENRICANNKVLYHFAVHLIGLSIIHMLHDQLVAMVKHAWKQNCEQ